MKKLFIRTKNLSAAKSKAPWAIEFVKEKDGYTAFKDRIEALNYKMSRQK